MANKNVEVIETLKGYMAGLKRFDKKIIESFQLSPMANEIFADKSVRRNLKKLAKEHIETVSGSGERHPDLINCWARVEDAYGESENYAWIIKGDVANAKRVLTIIGVMWEGFGFTSAYDCTGRPFSNGANFTQCGDRVFVTQTVSYDV
jgi:hypothetical protein